MDNQITTINPFTNKVLKKYKMHSKADVKSILLKADERFQQWKNESISTRSLLLQNVAQILEDDKEFYSRLITSEMGKPIKQSRAEIEKCAHLCDFYATNADLFLADELIETDALESFISYDPLGCILAIMPWNYPFWQVMRFAVPTLVAGNTALLKHATNVSGCSLAIQELFEKAGFPKNCFQSLLVDHDQIEMIIKSDIIKAVTLTGSEAAGRSIAAIAGKNLKKTVLELGGSNACIILDDANLDNYLDTIVNARMQNAGQSCIAAKRFIITKGIYKEFMDRFTKKVKDLKYGDPQDEDTEICVLARVDLANTLKKQVDQSLKKGAKLILGNTMKNAYFNPTIVTEVHPGMPIFDEETFGPVAAIIKADSIKHAFELAAQTKFGLGTMVFTENIEIAQEYIGEIDDGSYFINELVKSDVRLPFGGTKASGYGRELSKEGIHEFVNKKTVYIKK